MKTDLESFVVFPWNKNLETGITTIDDQHMVLIDLLNKLTRALVEDDEEIVLSIFNELAEYADYHFKAEETLWEPFFSDDPWCVAHQKTHRSFLPRLHAIKEKGEGEPLSETIESIVKFLIRWLAYHIIDNDKRMSIAVQNIESGASLESAKRIADEEMSGATRLLINTVLNMYDGMSSRTLDLLRERAERLKTERLLKEANRRLELMAIKDQLTGLDNRRHFQSVFQQELARARREKRPFHFCMFDLDNFKELNDHYGHLKGDDALVAVSTALKNACRRPGDYVFRLGGDEFGLIIVDQEMNEAQRHAESICGAVRGLGIQNSKAVNDQYVTVSGGVVSLIPEEGDTLDTIVSCADQRLYIAKSLGGNQVVFNGR